VLTSQNIEADLSYAYLHAVASRAGFACEYAKRHLDDAGVDAVVREDGRKLAADSVYSLFDLHVQLKATYQIPTEINGRYSFSLTVPRYDKLRNAHVKSPRILVVLYLPQNEIDWLRHSEEALIARRCAYWASLRNAPDSANPSYQTVYIPRVQVLSSDTLTEIMTRVSRREEMNYVP
jgi:hypothetical protein